MKLFSYRFIHVWQRNRDVFLRLWHTEAPGFVIEPVIVLLVLGLGLGAYLGMIGGTQYIDFIAPGIVASYAMYSAVFEGTYGAYIRMVNQSTYDAILATPLSAEDITAGEIFWGATRSLITGTAILAVSAAFQLVHSPLALLVPFVIFLEGLMFTALSVFFTSIVPSINSFNYYYTLFINPMFFVAGVFFPLSGFPPIIQNLSWIAPLTSVVHIVRALFTGQPDANVWLALAIIIAFTTFFFLISLMTMRRRLTT